MDFILIISSITKKENICSNAILFSSYKEALDYARNDVKHYKHLASIYTERLGENNLRAIITLKGKDINKCYKISELNINTDDININNPNTYVSWDYDSDDNLL